MRQPTSGSITLGLCCCGCGCDCGIGLAMMAGGDGDGGGGGRVEKIRGMEENKEWSSQRVKNKISWSVWGRTRKEQKLVRLKEDT
jgi:hypothetical protein